MKRKMKLIALTLCLLLLLSVGTAFADSVGPAENGEKSITGGSIGFQREGPLHGLSLAVCNSNVVATYIRAEYQVQVLDGDDYYDVGSPVNSYQYNTSGFIEERHWYPEYPGTYRIKVKFYERYNGSTKSYGWLYSGAAAL